MNSDCEDEIEKNQIILRRKLGRCVNEDYFESFFKENIEEELNVFIEAYESHDNKLISLCIKHIGKKPEMLDMVKIHNDAKCKVLIMFIDYFLSSPPLCDVNALLNIFSSLSKNIEIDEITNYFDAKFFGQIIAILMDNEENEEKIFTKNRVFFFIDSLIKIDQSLDDYILDLFPLQLLFELFEQTKTQDLKSSVLEFIAIYTFYNSNTEIIDDLIGFVFSIIYEIPMEQVVICFEILYYLEYNDSSPDKPVCSGAQRQAEI